MSEEGADTRQGGTGLWLAAVVVVGVLVAGVTISLNRNTEPSPEDLAAVVAPGTQEPSEALEPLVPEAATDEIAESAEGAASDAPEAAPQITPTVDEVRLEGDGLTVIAGRAEPGAQVSVRVDGEEVATAVADARGAFAAVGVVAPSDAARVLTLEAQGSGEAVVSDEDVILAPLVPQVTEAAPSAEAETPSEQAEASAGATDVAEAATGSEASESTSAEPAAPVEQPEVAALAPEIEAEAPNTSETPAEDPSDPLELAQDDPDEQNPAEQVDEGASQSVAVLKSTEDGVELLQPAPEAMTAVAIDTIGYSEAGDVQLSGRAVAGTSEVRVYLNNRFTAALPVDSDGGWRGSLPEVDAGIYQLRVDEVNTAGDVTSRVETPFKREAPAVLAEADDASDSPVRAVTVQTGDTLWAIARDRYGEGVLYVKVFEANRRDIRDPDLIYPGQVFDLPVE